MNENDFGNRFNSLDHVEETDKNTNNQAENSDPFADKTPLNEADLHETAMGGTVAAVGPMDGPADDVIPLFETSDQEIPMGGTLNAVGPMDDTVENVIPGFDNPDQETLMDDPAAAIGPSDDLDDEEIPILQIPDHAIPMGGNVVAVSQTDETITYETPIFEAPSGSLSALLNHEQLEYFRAHWNEIQGKFVDEPFSSVQQADALISEVLEQINQMLFREHRTLESQWNQGNDVSTENLRKTLQNYRSFFNRLVV